MLQFTYLKLIMNSENNVYIAMVELLIKKALKKDILTKLKNIAIDNYIPNNFNIIVKIL